MTANQGGMSRWSYSIDVTGGPATLTAVSRSSAHTYEESSPQVRGRVVHSGDPSGGNWSARLSRHPCVGPPGGFREEMRLSEAVVATLRPMSLKRVLPSGLRMLGSTNRSELGATAMRQSGQSLGTSSSVE